MTANQVRQNYLQFMAQKGYHLVKPVGLILRDDPTTLFTGSGMQPMVPYLLGQTHPEGPLLTDSQPCIRLQDIEEVGDASHTTLFEMLGDWSLDGFDKQQQIEWLFEFLTNHLKLDPSRLYVSCFIGDAKHQIPRDDESATIWQGLFEKAGLKAKIAEIGSSQQGAKRGIKPDERIFFYDDKENWWSRNGGIATTPLGDPCGPDSEVFYDFDPDSQQPDHPASDSGRFMEICNKVWMQYQRQADGSFRPLAKGKVDFGGGLSRLLAATSGQPDIFQTDLYRPIITQLEQLSGLSYADHQPAMRIIADHLTGAVWLAAQGLEPSNKEQGYVMRRLTRRAIARAFDLGVKQHFLDQLVTKIVEIYREAYPEMAAVSNKIAAVLQREESLFRKTLERGLREFDKIVGQVGYQDFADEALAKTAHRLSGQEIFKLQDTYGFPLELALEEAAKRQIRLSPDWRAEFDQALAHQRKLSQTAGKGEYKGGLTGDSETHKKYHTATHLLGAALRQVLKAEANQRGSNINDQRLRLDFAYPEKLTPEQLTAVENLVNQKIAEDLPVSFAEYDTDFAFDQLGAIGEFRDKYDDKVLVYTIGQPEQPFSVDICGGPHVSRTGELGHFRIVKQESSSAGVRRIKAVLE